VRNDLRLHETSLARSAVAEITTARFALCSCSSPESQLPYRPSSPHLRGKLLGGINLGDFRTNLDRPVEIMPLHLGYRERAQANRCASCVARFLCDRDALPLSRGTGVQRRALVVGVAVIACFRGVAIGRGDLRSVARAMALKVG
jgi:hypothetical protein